MTAVAYLGYDVGGDDSFNRRYLLERIPRLSLTAASVLDGWGETDDTATVTITDEAGITRYFYADILLVILETPDETRRLYGPFDVKDITGQNAIGEYTFNAVADRWIERTVFQAVESLQSEVGRILDLPTFSGWLDANTKAIVELKLMTGIQAAKSLSDIRAALGKYAFTVVPAEEVAITGGAPGNPVATQVSRAAIPADRLVKQTLTRKRNVKAAALAPLTEAWSAGADDGAGGNGYTAVEFEEDPNVGIASLRAASVARNQAYSRPTVRATQVHVPDRYNAPGIYPSRVIGVGYRVPSRGYNEIYSFPATDDAGNPTAAPARPLFPVELDAVMANRALGAWAANAARRELQNSAARAALLIPEGDVTLSPNNILTLDTPALPAFGDGKWRVIQVDHKTVGEALETTLEVVLWQGESTDATVFPSVVPSTS